MVRLMRGFVKFFEIWMGRRDLCQIPPFSYTLPASLPYHRHRHTHTHFMLAPVELIPQLFSSPESLAYSSQLQPGLKLPQVQ
jgi:hypothetical protein